MKAIVLTYDRNRALTRHMILKYDQLWPEHPFHFLIPFQEISNDYLDRSSYVKSPVSIKLSILKLIENIDDDEWVYFCIDDKFLIDANISLLQKGVSWIEKIEDIEISGILFCRCRSLLLDENLTGQRLIDPSGNEYLERKNYKNIWIHQFLRAKVLRRLFLSMPDKISKAKDMDLFKDRITKPRAHRLFVIKKNQVVFAESTTKGVITKSCYLSMKSSDMEIPEWVTHVDIVPRIMGSL